MAFTVCMASTTLPTPLYVLYSMRFGFRPLTVTILFAVYAIGVVATLAVLGRLSDAIGRLPVLLTAVGISVAGSLLLAAAPGLAILLAGRVVSGLAAGLMSGAGTAAVIDLFPPARRGAGGAVAVAANTGGLAAGTLVAGIAAEVGPRPLVTPYLLQAGAGLLAALALAVVARQTGALARPARSRFQISRLRVPPEIRASFARAVLAGGSGFAVTGVLTAVSSLFLATTLHVSNHALAGAVVALVFAAMAAGQLATRRADSHAVMRAGCAGLFAATVVLLLALLLASLAALLIAGVGLGLAEGACLNAGIATTVERVPPAQRGEVSSSYFAGLYVFLAVPAIGVGLLTARIGLIPAGATFCAVVMVLTAVTAWLEHRVGAPR